MAKECLLCTRREFLKAGSILAVGAAMPTFLARAAAAATPEMGGVIKGFKDDRILVVVQLGGGNDGLNMVVPFTDDNYYRGRPTIAIPKDQVLRLTDELGLNPKMTALKALADNGQVAVIEGVGYPNPNRSHFRSTEIWQTATDSNRYSQTGWVGRYLDNNCSGEAEPVAAVAMGGERPQSFNGVKGYGVAFQDPNSFGWTEGQGMAHEGNFSQINKVARPHNPTLDFLKQVTNNAVLSSDRVREVSKKYKDTVQYPNDSFANGLKTVAKMIAGGLPTRIFYVSLTGFDTHANQTGTQNNLLGRFADGVAAFQRDLEQQGNAERVTMLTFSEFGRRVAENASGGTDHGTAAPMFVIGKNINAGLVGGRPNLTDLDQGDLKYTTDFRSVYASLVEQWLGADSTPILGQKFKQIALINKKTSARNILG